MMMMMMCYWLVPIVVAVHGTQIACKWWWSYSIHISIVGDFCCQTCQTISFTRNTGMTLYAMVLISLLILISFRMTFGKRKHQLYSVSFTKSFQHSTTSAIMEIFVCVSSLLQVKALMKVVLKRLHMNSLLKHSPFTRKPSLSHEHSIKQSFPLLVLSSKHVYSLLTTMIRLSPRQHCMEPSYSRSQINAVQSIFHLICGGWLNVLIKKIVKAFSATANVHLNVSKKLSRLLTVAWMLPLMWNYSWKFWTSTFITLKRAMMRYVTWYLVVMSIVLNVPCDLGYSKVS